jgi:hypothetical protein
MVHSIWQFRNRSARSVAPRIEWMQNRNIGALSVCLDEVLDYYNGDYSLHEWGIKFWHDNVLSEVC